MSTHLQSKLYTNPVVNHDFPDPSIIEVAGNGFFAYATHDAFSPTINNILVRHSWDLVKWSEATGALVEPPQWALLCNKFWCPHVVQVRGEFRLYYAAEPDTKDGMCLAIAKGNDPLHLKDVGEPLSRLKGSTYQMIDPCSFIDPVTGKNYLYYGSAHEPIKAVELAEDGITFLGEPTAVLHPADRPLERLREGAFVSFHPTSRRYLLWVSGDNTWRRKEYGITVFSSTEPMGNFEKIPGNHIVLQANEHWDAPGQNCLIHDHNGEEWIVYHAVDTKDRYIEGTTIFKRKMCMDKVRYTADGWPYIENGSPSYTMQKGPAIQCG
jgi:arabinan endo-1,5-alpha-L-arabinosidase